MPSSNKTLHLHLNKWEGGDKPKKDDFNGDNQKIDDAYGNLAGAVTQATVHAGDTAAHIAPAERTLWNGKANITVGTYVGNGASTRHIALGEAPQFGMVYAVAQPLVKAFWDSYNIHNFVGFFSAMGCSEGLALDSTGFTVTHHATNRPTGHTLKQNENGVTYAYVVWG